MHSINNIASTIINIEARPWSPEEDVCSDNETPVINYGDILIR